MTLTPDRRRDKQDRRDEPASSAVPGGEAEINEVNEVDDSPTYRELLRGAGFDLDGHPLADRFDEVATQPPNDFEFADAEHPVDPTQSTEPANSGEPTESERRARWAGRNPWEASVDDPDAKAELKRRAAEVDAEKEEWMRRKAKEAEAERTASEGASDSGEDDDWAAFLGTQPTADFLGGQPTAESNRGGSPYRPRHVSDTDSASVRGAVSDSGGVPISEHPLLDEHAWGSLARIAPEVADSIQGLQSLVGDLQSLNRPMGPEDAITVLDGLETVNRLVESLSVVTLSVFERVGTPRDYGAKSTKALVQNRLNLSEREAYRRSDLAEHLGNQVNFSGQPIGPKFPVVSEALQNGSLSSTQASTIIGCLKDLPLRASQDERLEAERILVEKAPTVRVKDIQQLFNEILGWLDPDGELPDEAPKRDDLSVSLRQRKDGTWALRGVLDAVTGGIMSGHLTSRIKADDNESSTSDKQRDSATDTVSFSAGATSAADQEVVDVFSQVLRGDRSDAVDPALDLGFDQQGGDGLGAAKGVRTTGDRDLPPGYGVREDGSTVAMADRQPSVKNKIYERFATMIGRIEMNRVRAGSPFALVVTAKAEDLAKQSGRAVTDAEASFPMQTASYEGLNGSVFFHLMSEKTKSMELATERRFATSKQLAILSSRDQGCTFPGCDTPPGWCDAHHIVPWAKDGKTDVNNLTLACGSHHHLIDDSDWHTVMLKDGRPAWVPPASIDPARRPILHARFIAKEITDTLFD
ncbi:MULTISPECIES: HNH endonuclease signature motif containing protein [Brevibacterium]|uniref:HNH endonuclease n=1 Tax=Brevibacterium antiquum CNRZ 918 TaxID=1255637 RepID=A0A2H1JY87_9MICO|nr:MULTISPECIES: HNH endonuclease signature motif containing protein [Brevibacterium]SMX92429.1 HNH endonuclease [Brevibacterium antiquum CNRZ 918]